MSILEQIAQGENAGLEFKVNRPADSLKFTKTVVAFANGRGGRLLFGVEDGTGRVVGLERETVAAEMDAIVNAVVDTCTPRISIDVKPATINGKVLIAVDVKAGEKTPYYVNALGMRKGTFVRVGATSRQAEEHTLKGLILAGDNLSFDKQVVAGMTLTRKDVQTACQKMTELARRNRETAAERKAVREMTETRMISMGLLKRNGRRILPTYGYCVVSGTPAPDILTPQIKCGLFRGTKKGDFLDRCICEGGIVEQIEKAYQFVLRNIRVGTELVGTARRDVYELPIDAIREAICNAVFHRDYLVPSCVYVALYDDRLDIVSPGGLVREMTIEDAKNGFSKIRNHAIGAALEYMGEVEGWGGGVMRYFEACRALRLPLPRMAEEANCVTLTFSRNPEEGKEESKEETPEGKEESKEKAPESKEKSKEKAPESKEKEPESKEKAPQSKEKAPESKEKAPESKEKSKEEICTLLAANPMWTTNDLARELCLSRSGIERNLRLLKRCGRLKREGADRGGKWVVSFSGCSQQGDK